MSVETEGGRRTTSRFERAATLPRCLALFALLLSASSFYALCATAPSSGERLFGLTLCLVVIPWAFRSSGTGSPVQSALLSSLALVAAWMSYRTLTATEFSRFFVSASVLLACALIAVTLASLLGLASSAKATLASLAMVAALLLGESIIRRSETPRRPRDESLLANRSTPDEAEQRAPRDRRDRYEMQWEGLRSNPHPGLDYLYAPDQLFKNFYPSNPRLYFVETDRDGPLDMRMWSVRLASGTQAKIARPTDGRGVLRIEPEAGFENGVWTIALEQRSLVVLKDELYQFSFRAKGAAERTLSLSMQSSDQEPENLGLFWAGPVTTSWRTYATHFKGKKDDGDARLIINAGKDKAPVEIEGCWLAPIPRQESGEVDNRFWRSQALEGAVGAVEAPAWPDGPAKVTMKRRPQAEPWSVQILQETMTLREGRHYWVTFQARADQPRDVQLLVLDSRDPSKNMGLNRTVSLTPSWQYFGGEFTAMGDDPHATMVFNAGAGEGSFEIGKVVFTGERAPRSATPRRRYAIEYRINGEGFRDRDHSKAKPPETYRIACMGDSFTFAQGVHEPDSFVRRLQDELNAGKRSDEATVETMNFGVCGYSTRQERVCYEEFASAYQPDLALIAMVHNDNLSYQEEEALGLHAEPTAAEKLFENFRRARQTIKASTDYSSCVAELKRLAEQCAKRSCRLAVVIFRDSDAPNWDALEAQVTKGLEGSSIPLLNLRQALTRLPFAVLKVHEVDGHPNEIAHAIAAGQIATFLRERQLVPRATTLTSKSAQSANPP